MKNSQKINRTSIRLLGLIGFFCSVAQASVEFRDPRTDAKITDGSYIGEEGFVETQYGVRAYGLIIRARNADLSKKDWTLKGGDVFQVGQTKNFLVGSHEAFLLDESKKPILKILWIPEKKGMSYDQCPQAILSAKMVKTEASTPFPIGVGCNVETNPPRIMVSVPSSVEWEEHGFQEMAGKGERWRVFDLPSGNLKNDQVGWMVFRAMQKLWRVSLHVKTLTPATGRSLGFDKSFSLGFGSASLTASGQSYSSSDLMIRFEGATEPLLNFLKLGVFMKFNTGFSSSLALIFGKDVGMSAGYFRPYADGEKRLFSWGGFAEYRSIDYKHQTTNFSLQASMFSAGASAEFMPSPRHKFRAVGRMGNFGSNVVSAYTQMQGGYQMRMSLFGVNTWVGGTVIIQNLSATNSSGEERSLAENQFLLTIDF